MSIKEIFTSSSSSSSVVSPDTVTENGDAAFSSTFSSCLDFFGTVCRSEKRLSRDVEIKILDLLPKMWQEDPLLTTKLIFHKRDCREGAGEKAIFYTCYKWLLTNHPNTAYENMKHFPFFGYWKDYLALLDPHSVYPNDNNQKVQKIAEIFAKQLLQDLDTFEKYGKQEEDVKSSDLDLPEEVKEEIKEENKEDETKQEHSSKDEEKVTSATNQQKPKIPHVSLCAKWAPTNKLSVDRRHKICKLIANAMGYDDKWQMHYRKALSKLRHHLDIVEKNMCAKLWSLIKLDKVPSVCMMKNKKAFKKNMPNEFAEWMSNLKTGKTKVNAKQLMVHELIELRNLADELTQHQWNAIRDHLKTKGSLGGVIPVSDVSGSMNGIPMQVSVALGIMISELAEEPFKDLMITFSSDPQFFKFEGKTLSDKVYSIHNSGSIGYNTDIIKTFKVLLDRCVEYKLTQEKMPKKVLIITDGQFDEQTRNSDSTSFETIKRMYNSKGYEPPVLVLWNVRGNITSVPITKHSTGSILISGWSTNLLKSIMEATDLPTPMDVMMQTISVPRYDCIKVVD